MEKIKTIRLYRYNIGITEENDCTEYMTMDCTLKWGRKDVSYLQHIVFWE